MAVSNTQVYLPHSFSFDSVFLNYHVGKRYYAPSNHYFTYLTASTFTDSGAGYIMLKVGAMSPEAEFKMLSKRRIIPFDFSAT